MARPPKASNTIEMAQPTTIITKEEDLYLRQLQEEQKDQKFPTRAEVNISEGWQNPFVPPPWANLKKYDYGFAEKVDVAKNPHALANHWKIVNIDNHPHAPRSAFRMHGAVEVGDSILIYRPRWITEEWLDQTAREHVARVRGDQQKFEDEAPIMTTGEGGKTKVVSRFYKPDGDMKGKDEVIAEPVSPSFD